MIVLYSLQIRMITLVLGGEGYLNFMGNEFGHPGKNPALSQMPVLCGSCYIAKCCPGASAALELLQGIFMRGCAVYATMQPLFPVSQQCKHTTHGETRAACLIAALSIADIFDTALQSGLTSPGMTFTTHQPANSCQVRF